MPIRIKSLISIIILVTCIGIAGCNKKNQSQNIDIDFDLLKQLADISGEYTWRDDLKRFVFSEKEKIEFIISQKKPDMVLYTLVNSLDRRSNSNSTIDGKQVVLGIVCYEALTQLVYYEPTTSEGDIAKKWAGYITPKATIDELEMAKKEWMLVVESKKYIFL